MPGTRASQVNLQDPPYVMNDIPVIALADVCGEPFCVERTNTRAKVMGTGDNG